MGICDVAPIGAFERMRRRPAADERERTELHNENVIPASERSSGAAYLER